MRRAHLGSLREGAPRSGGGERDLRPTNENATARTRCHPERSMRSLCEARRSRTRRVNGTPFRISGAANGAHFTPKNASCVFRDPHGVLCCTPQDDKIVSPPFWGRVCGAIRESPPTGDYAVGEGSPLPLVGHRCPAGNTSSTAERSPFP